VAAFALQLPYLILLANVFISWRRKLITLVVEENDSSGK